jgi:hypothetical protein
VVLSVVVTPDRSTRTIGAKATLTPVRAAITAVNVSARQSRPIGRSDWKVPDVGRNGRDGGDQFGSALPEALFINAGTGLESGDSLLQPPTSLRREPSAKTGWS